MGATGTYVSLFAICAVGAAVTVAFVACRKDDALEEGCAGAGGADVDCGGPVDDSSCPSTRVSCDGPEGLYGLAPIHCGQYGMTCPGDGGHTCAPGTVLTLPSAYEIVGCYQYCCAEPDAGADVD
jgi:hypothetical protein